MNKQIYRRALTLAVPMMIQNGITNMVGLVDNVMVGSLGTEAMSAVSIAGQLIFVFNLAIFGGLSGPGIYGAQFYGSGNTEGVRSTFRMKIWICLFSLTAGICAFLFGGETLIGLYLSGEGEAVDPTLVMQYGRSYLNIMLFGLLPFAVTQIYAGTLRETGESIKPMAAGIASVVVDIVFNYLLIYGSFGFPKLGVDGAAIATVLARLTEMTIIVVWSHVSNKRRNNYEFLGGIYRTLKIPSELAKKIIIKSLPIFMNEFMWAGGMAALTQCYSGRGLDIVPAVNISNALCNLLNVVFIALGSAVGIIIGQTLGASQFEKAKKDAFSLMWFSGIVCIGLAAVLIAFSGLFPQLYDTTEEIRSLGQSFIIITAAFFPVQGFLNALYFTLRSGGKTVITFLFDSVFTWTVCFTTAFVLCNFTSLDILAIYAVVQSLDIIKVIIGYILIRKGIWISNIIE